MHTVRILSNNKILGLKNGSFFGLRSLERLNPDVIMRIALTVYTKEPFMVLLTNNLLTVKKKIFNLTHLQVPPQRSGHQRWIACACGQYSFAQQRQFITLRLQFVLVCKSGNAVEYVTNIGDIIRDLKNNLISTIEPGAFYGLSELKRLDLSNNRIGCLTPEMFVGLNNLHKLHFSTDSLICDCNLRWILQWARNASVRIAEETVCAYPSALRGLSLYNLKENQLICAGPLELPLFELIPSQRQVVFHGDRLPFQCTATYVDNTTQVHWYHAGRLVETDEESGIFVEDSIIHDCCLITRELILSSIDLDATGNWECLVNNSYGNSTKQVEIVVLETAAPYCPAERVINNKGDFRWPKTLAGITAYHPCLQYSFNSISFHTGAEVPKAWRKCNRTGRWDEENYSECPYSQEITQVLHAFSQMHINLTTVLEFSRQLTAYTRGASFFADKMDVIYLAYIMEKLIVFVDEVEDIGDALIEIASNIMLVDDHVLWMAQKEDKACTRIVRCVEHIASQILTSNVQVISKVSRNIALEAFMIKPSSFTGMTCTAFQKISANSDKAAMPELGRWEANHHPDLYLNFKCNTGNLNGSLVNSSTRCWFVGFCWTTDDDKVFSK
ncbi:G-protein coupled receptor 124 [Pitangus sulphuratus]|nr:G-protein coupled receptor 124 [Pitangus sulphuratus]